MIDEVETGTSSDKERSEFLSDPELRRALCRSLATRVPQSEIDDLVQATLIDALSAAKAPRDTVELRRWVYGILRNKVSDHYRGTTREVLLESDSLNAAAESGPASARDLLRWAEKELPPGDGAERTLDWMLEEADGEKLEDIARAERVPAARVRQRVARLRRHFRERWAARVGAVATALVVAAVAFFVWQRSKHPRHDIVIAPEPSARPVERGVELRRMALDRCAKGEYAPCLRELDAAKALDPKGDSTDVVRGARSRAAAALVESPTPTTTGNPAPTPAPRPSSLEAPAPAPTSPQTAPRSTATPPPTPAPHGSTAPTGSHRKKAGASISSDGFPSYGK